MLRSSTVEVSGLRERIQSLVTARFGGRENRAAGAWGVSQSSLNRFLKAVTSRPSIDFLKRIASHEGVSMEWLLDGTGPAPALANTPEAERAAWHHLVRSLGLSDRCATALTVLPGSTHRAFIDLTLRGLTGPMGPGEGPFHFTRGVAERAWHAAWHEYLAWTELLEGMIEAYGKEAVAAKLDAEWLGLALGYQSIPLNIYAAEAFDAVAVERAISAASPSTGITVTQGLGPVTVPPLEQTWAIRAAGKGAAE